MPPGVGGQDVAGDEGAEASGEGLAPSSDALRCNRRTIRGDLWDTGKEGKDHDKEHGRGKKKTKEKMG